VPLSIKWQEYLITWLPVLLVFRATFNNMAVIVIPAILLKVALKTNKTGNQVISYSCHIVESGSKNQ
jgi:hypothetical protein